MKNNILSLLLLVSGSAIATDMAVVPSNGNTSSSTSVSTNSCGLQKQEACLFVISAKHVNRIVTPFENPSVKMDNIGGVAYKAKDNVLYISTTSPQPIAGFITESGDESNAIKVILKPMSIGPQEIVLGQSSGGSEVARKFERSSPRSRTITEVISTLAKGKLPAGYQIGPVNAGYIPECSQAGMSFDFFKGQFVSGGDYVVSIGTVKNESKDILKFTENSCYKDGVIAVSAYPSLKLLPSQKSEVYVMYYRNKPVSTATPARKSLLGGE